jgi:septation ring formation regulator EzrA
MNSSEQKDFEYITPTEEEINDTVAAINELLSSAETFHSENKDLQEGYEEAKRLLISRKNKYDEIIPVLTSTKGKAVAVLAVKYLNGECSREVLMGLLRK